MRSWIIVNPRAGSGSRARELRDAVAGRAGIRLVETERGGHAGAIARAAVDAGADTIVAAGGDGTIHEVVQALAERRSAARLGIVPLGTANDFARTLALPTDPAEALARIEAAPETRAIDVMEVTTPSAHLYGINVAAGGFSGQVDEALTDELKATWGPLAYARTALAVLPDRERYVTTLAWDDGDLTRVDVFNVVVANGPTCAGGLTVAPGADLEDGLLDVMLVHAGSLLDLARVGAALVTGGDAPADLVERRRVRSVRIASRPGMWFAVDGELVGNEPTAFRVIPRAVRVVAGATYRASRAAAA